MDFRHLLLEESAQETLVGARHYYLGVVVGVLHACHHGTHHVALAEEVAGYLLLLGHDELVLVLVEKQYFAFPDLMHLAGDYLTFEGLELGREGFLLEVEDFRLQGLAQVQDGAAAEFLEENLLGHLFAQLALGVYLACSREPYLHILVLYLAVGHNPQILVNLAVSLVGVHDYVEVLVGAEHLGQYVADADHHRLVYVLELLELGELVDHIHGLCFSCHIFIRDI